MLTGNSTTYTHGSTCSGTSGISSGCTSPTTPNTSSAARAAAWQRATTRVAPVRADGASTAAARITPPAGTASTPARPTVALRAYSPRNTPGVARPWIVIRPAMTVKATPTSPARVSFLRIAARVISTDTAAATAAVPVTASTCSVGSSNSPFTRRDASATSAGGVNAARQAAAAAREMRGICGDDRPRAPQA